jgi:hypothetical protein
MKRLLFACVAIAAFAAAAHAQPPALPETDFCATYTFVVGGKGGTDWSVCRSGTKVWTADERDGGWREIWDITRATMIHMHVPSRSYFERDYAGRPESAINAQRPYPIKRLAQLLDSEELRFERVGTETLGGRTVTKWRFQVREGRDHVVFAARGFAWVAEGGVLVKLEGENGDTSVELKSKTLEIGPVDEERFRIPRGYKRT